MLKFVLIALGGGTGAVLVYAIQGMVQPKGSVFPLGTLLVNVTGCLVIGFLIAPFTGRISSARNTAWGSSPVCWAGIRRSPRLDGRRCNSWSRGSGGWRRCTWRSVSWSGYWRRWRGSDSRNGCMEADPRMEA